MRLFSSWKKFKLKLSDFKTESKEATVTTTWISPDFLKMLPHPPKDIPPESTYVISKSNKAVVRLFGVNVEVFFDPDEISGDNKDFVKKINDQLNWIASNRSVIDAAIVQELLELKNSEWLNANEFPLTSKEFLNRIKLESVEIFEDLAFELTYDDGRIFAGHWISVPVTSDKKIEKIMIVG